MAGIAQQQVKPDESLVIRKLAEVAQEYGVEPEDVLDFAEYLGMHPYEDKGDLEFLWLAAEGIFAPLPAGWAEYKMPDGQPYFYNIETRRSQWEHPMDAWYRALYLKQKKEGADQSKLRAHFKKNKGSPEKLTQKHMPGGKSRSLKRRLTSMLKGRKSKKNITGDDTASLGSTGERDDTMSVNSQQTLPEEIMYQRSMFPEHDEQNARRTSFDGTSAAVNAKKPQGEQTFQSTIENLKAQATTNDAKLQRMLDETMADKDKAMKAQAELSKESDTLRKEMDRKAKEASDLARAKEQAAEEIVNLRRRVELAEAERNDFAQKCETLATQLTQTEEAALRSSDSESKVYTVQITALKEEKRSLEEKLKVEREQQAEQLRNFG